MGKNTISRPVFQVVANRRLSDKDKESGKSIKGKSLSERFRFHLEEYSIQECSELAILQPKDFESIFGKKNPDYGSKLAIVKITNPKTKKSIHRCFRTSSSIHGLNDFRYIALSYNSLLELSKDTDSFNRMDELEITPGCRWIYYWKHPYSMTRVAFKLGVISVLLSIISVLLSICV